MKCNKGNEGRMYVLNSEMNQDVVVCLRRTSPQTGSEPRWAWKSMTNGLWVEKGINPGNEGDYRIAQDHRNNPGIPTCNESLQGEVHEFTEDRGFRTIEKRCQRDENGNFSWVPVSAIPTYFRSLLPTCSETVHGMQAIVDDGNNSEVVVCQRYQGVMRWVRNGKRIPNRFHKKGPLVTKEQFLSSFGPISELETKSGSGFDWAGQSKEIVDVALNEAMKDIPLTGTDPQLKIILAAMGKIPSKAFDRAETLRRIGVASITKRTGLPIDELSRVLREELDRQGPLDPVTGKVIEGLGEAADILINGAKFGTEAEALERVGQRVLQASVASLSPQSASVVTSLMSGGVVGAIDAAVAIGLDKLPEEANVFVKPVVDAAKTLLSGQPVTMTDLVNSAIQGGLSDKASKAINKAIGANIVSAGTIEVLAESLLSGGLGEVGKLFTDFNNLDSIISLPEPYSGVPKLASSVLGLFGQEGGLQNFFGEGGIGLEALSSFFGPELQPALTILKGVKDLAGLLKGGANQECPCGPKCRKTEHGKGSDGINTLESCRSLPSNTANSYSGSNVPVPNNTGPVAKEEKLVNTLIGSPLIPSNPTNLTASINEIPRVGEMASRFYDARYADTIDFILEHAYTYEATEKALKVADNNITKIESIERKLIDAMFNLINDIVCNKRGGGGLSVMTELIGDVRENAQAIRDLYNYVKAIDLKKRGKKAGVRVTPSIAKTFQNISSLSKLSARNCKGASKILNGAVTPAHSEWLSIEPGNNFSSVLGVYSPDIPVPFPNEQTIFNNSRVLSESLNERLGEYDPQSGDEVNSLLNPRQAQALQNTPFSSIPTSLEEGIERQRQSLSPLEEGIERQRQSLSPLEEGQLSPQSLAGPSPIEGGESLYDRITNRTGQTNCE
jgi:hypothetical protein